MIALQQLATVPIGRPPARVRFGLFELDPRSGELSSGEIKVVLPRQPFQILLLLIECPGEVVTRDEIQKRLWSDDVTVDFDIGINQAVRKLRRLLKDSADEPRYIETLGRRGYRLKVPVELANVPSAPAGVVVNGCRLGSMMQTEVLDATGQAESPAAEVPKLAGAELTAFQGPWSAPANAGSNECDVESNTAEARSSSLAPLPDVRSLRRWLAQATANQRADVLEQLLQIAAQIASGPQQQRALAVSQGQALGNGAPGRQNAVKTRSAQHRLCRAPHYAVR